jgi:hypothetical protein
MVGYLKAAIGCQSAMFRNSWPTKPTKPPGQGDLANAGLIFSTGNAECPIV